jgi:hypothetical protein
MALDPSYFFYSEGTISLTNGSDIATGNFTAWDPAVLPFDFVYPNDGTAGMSVIKEVLAMDEIRLAKPWTGPTLIDVPYFMVRWTRHTDPRIYALRVSDYLTRLKGIPENIEEFADQISADAAAVAAAMAALAGIEANVDADRQAAETAAGTATGAAGAAAQSAATAQQWAEAASTTVLPNNSVSNAKLADMPTASIKGRATAGIGDPEDLTGAQAASILPVVRYDAAQSLTAAQKTQAISNIGSAFRKLDAVKVTGGVGSGGLVIPIPSDVMLIAIRGVYTPSVAGARLGMRVSRDGGSVYDSASNSYIRGYIFNSGASLTANAVFEADTLYLTFPLSVTALFSTCNAIFSPGAAGKNARLTTLNGGQDGSGINSAIDTYNVGGAGRVTHLSIFASSGVLGDGTAIVVEGY